MKVQKVKQTVYGSDIYINISATGELIRLTTLAGVGIESCSRGAVYGVGTSYRICGTNGDDLKHFYNLLDQSMEQRGTI